MEKEAATAVGGGVGGGIVVSSLGQAGPERRTVNVITLKFMCICKSQSQREGGREEQGREVDTTAVWDVQHVEQQ